jgi:hypothetical protein
MAPDDHTAPHPTQHACSAYVVPEDPMAELQCDSCQ